nr:hypothetical protein [Tanacetum cinerariifolium]
QIVISGGVHPNLVTPVDCLVLSKEVVNHNFDLQDISEDFQTSNEELKEPVEDQPLSADASPTALSLGYVVDSDLEKDEKDPKEDPAYYLVDRGNNDDDESSNDDDDVDDVEKDEEDKEEEKHLALANPFDVSTDDLMLRRMRRTRRRRSTQLRPTLLMYRQMILSPQDENTEAFETDESASTPSTILPPPRNVDKGFIASVVGGGVGVDCDGRGVKDDIDYGMTVEYIGEDSMITDTSTVRSMGICFLSTL